jgi:hypothetical protein
MILLIRHGQGFGYPQGVAMNLRRWILVYLATGPSFARWAILAFLRIPVM